MPLGVFYCPVFRPAFPPFLSALRTPDLLSDTLFRAPFCVPPYAPRRMRQNSRVGSCRMRSCGGGGICGDAALRKKSPFSDRRSVLSSFGKNANGGGRGAFPVKNIVFSGRKTGIRKKKQSVAALCFQNFFPSMAPLFKNCRYTPPAMAPFCNSCRRMSHFMAPLCKGSCLPYGRLRDCLLSSE